MLERCVSCPLLKRIFRNMQPCVQVNADSINDISAYASDQDKFSPGEGLAYHRRG